MSSPHLSTTSADTPAIPAVGRELRGIFALLDEVPGGVLLLDAEGTVKYLNGIAELRLDQPKAEVLGRDLFRDVLPQLDREGLGGRYRAAMAARRVALAADVEAGPTRRLHLGIRSFDASGTPLSIVLVEDRSALAREEERRKRAERLAAVGELAAGVAHEVNNPLASIKSFAQLLAREPVSEEQGEALEIIDQEASRIARTIDHLLGFARQQDVRETEEVNLGALVEHVLQLRRYTLQSSGIAVQADVERDLSPVRGEVGALQRLALLLVFHAEQTLGAQEGERVLTVRTREASDGVILCVADNGPGLPRERLAALFEAAVEGEPGPGLCGAATIAREHGGQIWAESAAGRGTAVFVKLPRAEPTPEPVMAPVEVYEETPPVTGLRVLLADDEATLRLAVALFLRRNGHEVVEAVDAHEALRLATETEFDVALVDALMPGDGLALIDKLQRIPHLRGRTALMTGDSRHVHTTLGEDPGFPFLLKPFEMSEIVRLVERLGR